MKIKFRHPTSLSVSLGEQTFGVIIDGEDDGEQCWIVAEERADPTQKYVLSQKFATLSDVRSAWHDGFTVSEYHDATIKRIVDELVARDLADES